jgi:hypothetical protein
VTQTYISTAVEGVAILLIANDAEVPPERRTKVPRIENYAEITVPRQSMEDIKSHFRLTRHTFEQLVDQLQRCPELQLDESHGRAPFTVSGIQEHQNHFGPSQTDLGFPNQPPTAYVAGYPISSILNNFRRSHPSIAQRNLQNEIFGRNLHLLKEEITDAFKNSTTKWRATEIGKENSC